MRTLIDSAGYNFAEFRRALGEPAISVEAMRSYTNPKRAIAPIRPMVLRRIAEKLNVSMDVLRVDEADESVAKLDRLRCDLSSGELSAVAVIEVAREFLPDKRIKRTNIGGMKVTERFRTPSSRSIGPGGRVG